ncbi:MAG: hypothetical protein WBI95_24835 [Pseudomonas veronii]|uniref:hypothetical protein n=1 Tax=Pseudomonas veronii TaxID=76761 RepID=UPI003C73BF27
MNAGKYDTLVVEGMGNSIPREVAGMRVAAWGSGHAFERSEELETFIRAVADGEFDDPEQAANDLMERMQWA